MKILCGFLILLLCLLFNAGLAQNNGGLKFIPNQGQIADRNYNPRPDVLFQVEGKAIYVRENGLTFVLTNIDEAQHEAHEKMEEIEHSEAGLGNYSEPEWEVIFLRNSMIDIQQVSMTFLKVADQPLITTSKESTDYLNYYLPQCKQGITKVHTYAQLEYRELYQGIDLDFYSNEKGELKYDFRVKAGADPNQIKMKWTGADNVSIQNDGSLLIETKIKNLTETMPLTYQLINGDTIKIKAQYKLKEKWNNVFVVSYEFGDYDQTYDLIIDPWITNYGAENGDNGIDVATDVEGNVLLTGLTTSPTAIAEDGFANELIGESDAYLVKFNAAGERMWGTYYGGEGSDGSNSVIADHDNNIYIAGSTMSEESIAYEGHQNTHGGIIDAWIFTFGDAFLVKFAPDGSRIWATYYGGEMGDLAEDVNVSDDGFVYLSGNTNSDTAIATLDGFQTTYGGGIGGPDDVPGDAFLVKFTSDGERVWGTYYGDIQLDYGNAVSSDGEGNVYMGGSTSSVESISTPGSYQEVHWGQSDAYIVKFSPSGDRIWATYFGGELRDKGEDLVVDVERNALYLAGYTTSPEYIAFEGFQMSRGDIDFTKRDAFLAKFSLEGERIWGTYFGGLGNDYAIDLGLDHETGNIAICGDTYALDLPVSDCALQTELSGLENAFATQFDPSGELYCSSYFGADHEENNKMAFGGCYLYIIGSSPIGVASPGAHQEIFGGLVDAFLAQLYKSSCGIELPLVDLTTEKIDVTDCNACDGSFTINVATAGCVGNIGGINYRWSTGEEFLNTTDSTSSVDGLCPGEHWVEVQLDCGVKDTVFFEMGSDLNIPDAAFNNTEICLGETITFTDLSTTDEGTIVSHAWRIDGIEISTENTFDYVFDSTGTYEVVLFVVNSDDCADSVSHQIIVHPNYELTDEITVCQNALVTFGDGHQIYATNDTSYTASLTSSFGCDSMVTTNVLTLPNIHISDTVFVQFGIPVQLFNGDEIIIDDTYVDTSILLSETGCDSITIITYLIDDFEFNPPNVFTPNSDNANNTFYFPNQNILTFECVIVNRWGVEVFQFNEIMDQWDGKNETNGKDCPDGVYFFTYSGTYINSEPFLGQGTVLLIRGK